MRFAPGIDRRSYICYPASAARFVKRPVRVSVEFNDMKIDKIQSVGMRHEYKVTFFADIIEAAIVSAVRKRARTFKMRGFRPGHAPLNIVRNAVEGEVAPVVLETMISDACNAVVKGSGVTSLATRPSYTVNQKYDNGQNLEITVFVDEAPNVEIKPYEFSLTKVVPSVSKEDVETELRSVMYASPACQSAAAGYLAKPLDVIEYYATYYVSGVVSKKQSFNNSVMLPNDIPEDALFLQGFIGKAVGDSFDYASTTENNVTYNIRIDSIQEALTDLSPDEYAQKYGFKDADELRTALRKRLENEITSKAYLYHKNQILETIIDQYSFELPRKIVENERMRVIGEVRMEMSRERDDNPDAEVEEKTDEELAEEYEDVVKKRVLLGYVLSGIANKEGISATNDEVRSAIEDEMNANPSAAGEIAEFYYKNEGAVVYKRAEITERKVVTFLMSVADVTEEAKTKEEVEELIEKLLND